MEFYKPYSFLFKETNPFQLTAHFFVKLHAEEKLSGVTKVIDGNTTTLEYSIDEDTNQNSDHTVEVSEILNWDGREHTVRIIIGSGSGSTGGTSTLNTDGYN